MTVNVQLNETAAQALGELAKDKIADMVKARDVLIEKIKEWENICAALVGRTAAPEPEPPARIVPEPAPAPAQITSPAPAQINKVSLSETLKKSAGRFPYKLAEKFLVGKNTIWVHGDYVAIGRAGYDKKARLTLAELRAMDESKLSRFGTDKARAVLRVVLHEVDFSSMPPKAKAAAVPGKKMPEKDLEKKETRGGENQPAITELKFSLLGLPRHRAGNSEYVLCPVGIGISRDGYRKNNVYLSYPDFFSLVENPERVHACALWHRLKRSILHGFLKDITPEVVAQIRAQVGNGAHAPGAVDPDRAFRKILNTDTRVPREEYAKVG